MEVDLMDLLTSKEVMEKAGISRATLNNYIKLGILPKPEIKKPSSDHGRAPRIGSFPASVLDTIEQVKALKEQGFPMTQVAAKLNDNMPEKTEDQHTRLKGLDGIFSGSPQLTIDRIDYPAYLINDKFQLEWCNDHAIDCLFGNRWQLSNRINERNIFQLLFDSNKVRKTEGFEDILRFHLGLAKGKLSKSTLLMSDLKLDHDALALLLHLHDEVEPVAIKPVVYADTNFSSQQNSVCPTQMYASFFREGMFITYLPANDSKESLFEFLAHRDHLIGNLLRKRRPYLTNMAVLLADLQDSCKICAELPPEEYFELINAIWAAMEPIIRKYNAVSGKHVGDGAVYYFFPRPEENHVFNAIKCAQEIKDMMLIISQEWRNKKNWDNDLLLNIGIDQGEEWFGTIQTSTQIEFTVLGDTVNRAGRLSNFAQQGSIWATKIVLGKLTAAERGMIRFGISRTSEQGQKVLIPSSYS
ncbi:MAG: adenylate/guanylate cyclase domain-containing protein, partial [Mariprofundaceae bacterium]